MTLAWSGHSTSDAALKIMHAKPVQVADRQRTLSQPRVDRWRRLPGSLRHAAFGWRHERRFQVLLLPSWSAGHAGIAWQLLARADRIWTGNSETAGEKTRAHQASTGRK